MQIPLRVDFAGGWLDHPSYTRADSYVINCTISPKIDSTFKPFYKSGTGLGCFAAEAIFNGQNPIDADLEMGAGWQNGAVILETGLCIWESGILPRLAFKVNPFFLKGKMALLWLGEARPIEEVVLYERDYTRIAHVSRQAKEAVLKFDLKSLQETIHQTYEIQLKEGMKELPWVYGASRKYCGAGHGGYACYVFYTQEQRQSFLTSNKQAIAIEPYIRDYTND